MTGARPARRAARRADEAVRRAADQHRSSRDRLSIIFSPTVPDVEASAAWYQCVLGISEIPAACPHYGAEGTGPGCVAG